MKEFVFTHDSFFKSMLDHKRYREALLHQVLPENIKNIINLKSLKRKEASFINEDLKPVYADYLLETS
jgi:predicted transposase YdaD